MTWRQPKRACVGRPKDDHVVVGGVKFERRDNYSYVYYSFAGKNRVYATVANIICYKNSPSGEPIPAKETTVRLSAPDGALGHSITIAFERFDSSADGEWTTEGMEWAAKCLLAGEAVAR